MLPLIWLLLSPIAAAWTADLAPKNWRVINDTVMGGVSEAQVRSGGEGVLVFGGNLSLENNGGFTSTQTMVNAPNWKDSESLQLKIKGDGRTYICTIRVRDRRFRRIYYRAEFSTEKEALSEVTIPFSSFEPYVFGRRMPQVPPLHNMLDQIASVGIMLADKNQGPFSLQIEGIQTVARSAPSGDPDPGDDASIAAIFSSAIESGVPLFNSGQPQQCAELYDSAIASVLMLSDDQLSRSSRVHLQQARARAKAEPDPTASAWIYRHAMDWVIAQGRN